MRSCWLFCCMYFLVDLCFVLYVQYFLLTFVILLFYSPSMYCWHLNMSSCWPLYSFEYIILLTCVFFCMYFLRSFCAVLFTQYFVLTCVILLFCVYALVDFGAVCMCILALFCVYFHVDLCITLYVLSCWFLCCLNVFSCWLVWFCYSVAHLCIVDFCAVWMCPLVDFCIVLHVFSCRLVCSSACIFSDPFVLFPMYSISCWLWFCWFVLLTFVFSSMTYVVRDLFSWCKMSALQRITYPGIDPCSLDVFPIKNKIHNKLWDMQMTSDLANWNMPVCKV